MKEILGLNEGFLPLAAANDLLKSCKYMFYFPCNFHVLLHKRVACKVLPNVGRSLACIINIALADVELLPGHSASLVDQKVTVYGGMTADGRASNNT